ncbi:MAG: M56 family metallopeptidase [Gelidibacter sp.]
MDYVWKSSVIIALFYLCYQLFLQRETFFVGNRWFLLLGLVASIVVPLIVIPVYVEYTPAYRQDFRLPNEIMVAQPQNKNPFGFFQLSLIIYLIGVLFFLGKLISEFISLFRLIKRHRFVKDKYFHYIEADTELPPFSFFKWIVYNPDQFDGKELYLILNHEKVHARQLHSLDIIFAQLVCVLFWFNPLVWLYKKALQQNLEFIADQDAQIIAPCEKSYQNLLLKTSIPSHQLALTNNFYNSLIKKRIVMLHKSKSNRINAWKYTLVLPLLVVFIFNFNTETIAQTTNQGNEPGTVNAQNVLSSSSQRTLRTNNLNPSKKNWPKKRQP